MKVTKTTRCPSFLELLRTPPAVKTSMKVPDSMCQTTLSPIRSPPMILSRLAIPELTFLVFIFTSTNHSPNHSSATHGHRRSYRSSRDVRTTPTG